MKHTIRLIACFLLLSGLGVMPAVADESSQLSPADAQAEAQVEGIVLTAVGHMHPVTNDYFDGGDYQRSIALARIIVEAAPTFTECYNDCAYLMWSTAINVRKKDPAESRRLFAETNAFYLQEQRNNPNTCHAYYDEALLEEGVKHDYKAALIVSLKDVATPDANVLDWQLLARSYEKLGQLDKAESTWETIAKRWPDGPAVQMNLARVKSLIAAQKTAGTPEPAEAAAK